MKQFLCLPLLIGASTLSLESQVAGDGAVNLNAPSTCGDVNGDGLVDISDAVRILGYLFNGGLPPVCAVDPDRPIDMDGTTTTAELEGYSTKSLMDALRELRQRKQLDLAAGRAFQAYLAQKIDLVIAALGQRGVIVERLPIDDAVIIIEPPPTPDGRLEELSAMIAEKGDPTFALTAHELLAIDGTDPETFLRAGFQVDGNLATAITATSNARHQVPVVFVPSDMALLDIALLENDSGDPVEITYQHSDCIGPVACKSDCHSAGLYFHAVDTPVGTPLRCKRVNSEKTCTDKMATICMRQLYGDDKCTRPVNKSFPIEGWRCN